MDVGKQTQRRRQGIQPAQDAEGSGTDRKGDVEESGGGELTTKGVDGKIRSKDTIAPGNDPNPPNDKEHSAKSELFG